MISQLAFGIDGAMIIAFVVGIFAMLVAGSEIMLHGIVIPMCGACYSFFRRMTQSQFSTSSGEEGIGTGDFAYKLITNSDIQKLFTTLLIVAIILLVVSTIIKAITSEFNFQKDGNSKSKILLDAVKALALFVIVPIASILGLMLANFLLGVIVKALENAIGFPDGNALTSLLKDIVGNVGWGSALNGVLSFFGIMNFILIGCMWPIAKKMLGAVIGMFQRMFELAMLWAISAPVIALMPITESPYKSWVKEFTQRVLGLFGIVVSVNVIVFVIQLACGLIDDLGIKDFELFIGQLAIVYAGMAMLDSLASSIASIIGGKEYGTEGAKLGANMFNAVGKGIGTAFKAGALGRAATGAVGGLVAKGKAKGAERKASMAAAASAEADNSDAVKDENKKVDAAKDNLKKKQEDLAKARAAQEEANKKTGRGAKTAQKKAADAVAAAEADVAAAEADVTAAEENRDKVKEQEKDKISKSKTFKKTMKNRMRMDSNQTELAKEAQELAKLAGETNAEGKPTDDAIAAGKTLAGMKDKLKNSGLMNHAIKTALDRMAEGDLSGLGALTANLSDMQTHGVKAGVRIGALDFGGGKQLTRLVADREAEVTKLHGDANKAKAAFEESNEALKPHLEELKEYDELQNFVGPLTTTQTARRHELETKLNNNGAFAARDKRNADLHSWMEKQEKSDSNDTFIRQTHKMMSAPPMAKVATSVVTTLADSFFSDPTVQKAWTPIKGGWHEFFADTKVDITAEGIKATQENAKKVYKENYQVIVDAHEREDLAKKVEADGKTITIRVNEQRTQDTALRDVVTQLKNAKEKAIAKLTADIRNSFGTGKANKFVIDGVEYTNQDAALAQIAISKQISDYTEAIQAQEDINAAIQANDTRTLGEEGTYTKLREFLQSHRDIKIPTSSLDEKIAKLFTAIQTSDEAAKAASAEAAKAYDDIKDLAEKAKKLKEARKKHQNETGIKPGEI